MPDIVFSNLKLAQGFAPKNDVQDAFGYVTVLTVAGQRFAADIPVKAGMVGFYGSVVAVMQYFKWSGGLTDPIELKANFSTNNRNLLFRMLHTTLPNSSVTFGFVIYYFDQTSAVFYQAMAASAPAAATPLSGLIARQGKQKLLLSLSAQIASTTVQRPPNWEFELTAMPGGTAQHVAYAYTPGASIIKNWGVAVAG